MIDGTRVFFNAFELTLLFVLSHSLPYPLSNEINMAAASLRPAARPQKQQQQQLLRKQRSAPASVSATPKTLVEASPSLGRRRRVASPGFAALSRCVPLAFTAPTFDAWPAQSPCCDCRAPRCESKEASREREEEKEREEEGVFYSSKEEKNHRDGFFLPPLLLPFLAALNSFDLENLEQPFLPFPLLTATPLRPPAGPPSSSPLPLSSFLAAAPPQSRPAPPPPPRSTPAPPPPTRTPTTSRVTPPSSARAGARSSPCSSATAPFT